MIGSHSMSMHSAVGQKYFGSYLPGGTPALCPVYPRPVTPGPTNNSTLLYPLVPFTTPCSDRSYPGPLPRASGAAAASAVTL